MDVCPFFWLNTWAEIAYDRSVKEVYVTATHIWRYYFQSLSRWEHRKFALATSQEEIVIKLSDGKSIKRYVYI